MIILNPVFLLMPLVSKTQTNLHQKHKAIYIKNTKQILILRKFLSTFT
jgi:hypothetical protein